MNGPYRPTVSDMTDTAKFQKLSLADAGKFDQKVVDRTVATGWSRICRQRATTGVSRKAVIRARKEAQ